VDQEHAAEKIALVRTQAQASELTRGPQHLAKDRINYNLVNCTFIVLKEQGALWKLFLLLGVAAITGVQAFLPKPFYSAVS
jgi:ATP-binding cassette subfamily B (MDR/TAP) protein 1